MACILGPSQFLLMTLPPEKMYLTSKVVKTAIGPKKVTNLEGSQILADSVQLYLFKLAATEFLI